jgi:hypothetical protein
MFSAFRSFSSASIFPAPRPDALLGKYSIRRETR